MGHDGKKCLVSSWLFFFAARISGSLGEGDFVLISDSIRYRLLSAEQRSVTLEASYSYSLT